jgi:hypothetical protein
MDTSEVVVWCIEYGLYTLTIGFLVWGWIRWARNPREHHLPSWFSFCSFVMGTASCLIAVITYVWARVHPFPYFDPQLMFMFQLGALISFTAFLASLGGLWRRSALRWHALALAITSFLVWFMWASGE